MRHGFENPARANQMLSLSAFPIAHMPSAE
jgi:hypothetical protein